MNSKKTKKKKELNEIKKTMQDITQEFDKEEEFMKNMKLKL
jgi:hypothetical protein